MTRHPEELLLARTARRVAVQATGLVATIVVLLAALATGVVLHQQAAASTALITDAAARADDVNDPPADVWLVLVGPTGSTSSPGLPAGLPDAAAIASVMRTGRSRDETEEVAGRRVRLLTQTRGDGIVQAVLDLRTDHAGRRSLLLVLLGGVVVGLAAAAVVGLLLGRRAVRPLADALALQRTFVADASHELRTPLTLLSTRVQVLRRGLHADAPAAVLADADGLVDDVQQLGGVVEDLLLAADATAEAEPVPVDLVALCSAAAASAHAYARGRGVEVTAALGDGPVWVSGRPAALRRAVLGLVDNAVEHTPPGGGVRLTAGADGRTARLSVRDTGSGIRPQDAERVFARFHSGAQRSGRRGYGLGLALVRDVAVRHGGTVAVTTPPGEPGTEVTLVLPRGPVP